MNTRVKRSYLSKSVLPSLWRIKLFWSTNDTKLVLRQKKIATTRHAYKLKHETDVLDCFLFCKAFLLPWKIFLSRNLRQIWRWFFFLLFLGVCLLAQTKFSCINNSTEYVNVWSLKLTSKLIKIGLKFDPYAKFPCITVRAPWHVPFILKALFFQFPLESTTRKRQIAFVG